MNCWISDNIKTPPVWVEWSPEREPDFTRRRYLNKKARPARSVLKISVPYLNRFSQPDSIIPPGVQGLDRYAAMNNNPLKYIDPSGHCSVGGHWQDDSSPACIWIFDTTMGVTFTSGSAGSWSETNKMIARQAVWDVARAEGSVLGLNAQEAFRKTHGNVNFTWGRAPDDGQKGTGCDETSFDGGGCTGSAHQIYFMTLPVAVENKSFDEAIKEAINNVVHELGHSFGAKWFRKDGGYDPAGPYVNIPDDLLGNNGFYPGPEGASNTWRQHACVPGNCYASEAFADMFLGWVYGKWDSDINGVGAARNKFMTTNMTEWLK